MSRMFISYRRRDSAAESGRLHRALEAEFGHGSAFLDTSSIEPGAVWPERLDSTLRQAEVVLVVIGQRWLRAADEWGRRLIDKDGDWVRREVEVALDTRKHLIPLLIGGARVPPQDTLPASIARLTGYQAVELRDAYFDHDMRLVISQLNALLGTSTKTVIGPFPVPPSEPTVALNGVNLEVALHNWIVVESAVPESPHKIRIELFREYCFRSFRDAISFMNEVAPGCDVLNHHPRWENTSRTLRVHLTTRDIDHRISDRDIQLAKYLDAAFDQFTGATTSGC